MKQKTIIEFEEVNIGSKLILKNGKTAIVKRIWTSMLPTITDVKFFDTDLGTVYPDEVERIIK